MRSPRKLAGGALAVVFATLYGATFFFGGDASRTVRFDAPATSYESGWSWGSNYFWASAAATVVVDFDATIRRGEFYIWIRHGQPNFGPNVGEVRLERSGKGSLRVPIAESGLYRIVIDGSPTGHGYDVTYRVSWRIR